MSQQAQSTEKKTTKLPLKFDCSEFKELNSKDQDKVADRLSDDFMKMFANA